MMPRGQSMRPLYAVERRHRTVVVERNPNIIDLAQTGIVLVVGFALVAPGTDGKNALQHIVEGIQNSVLTGFGGASPGPPGSANNRTPGQGDEFQINTDPLVSQFVVTLVPQITAADVTAKVHVGIGHAGVGGQFICRLWAQSDAILGIPLLAGSPVLVADQGFNVGGDNDWTGYGVDFSNVVVTQGIGQVALYASILSTAGAEYTRARIPKGG
jgi:hypothetical protein